VTKSGRKRRARMSWVDVVMRPAVGAACGYGATLSRIAWASKPPQALYSVTR
jgi:predicted Zn-ribbon and HTH transcriptional regulator